MEEEKSMCTVVIRRNKRYNFSHNLIDCDSKFRFIYGN